MRFREKKGAGEARVTDIPQNKPCPQGAVHTGPFSGIGPIRPSHRGGFSLKKWYRSWGQVKLIGSTFKKELRESATIGCNAN